MDVPQGEGEGGRQGEAPPHQARHLLPGPELAPPEGVDEEGREEEHDHLAGEVPSLPHAASGEEDVDVEEMFPDVDLTAVRLLPRHVGRVYGGGGGGHYEGSDADVEEQGEKVGDGYPEVPVDVEQHHPHQASLVEPAVGLVEVLEEEEGEEGGSYEEEGVH